MRRPLLALLWFPLGASCISTPNISTPKPAAPPTEAKATQAKGKTMEIKNAAEALVKMHGETHRARIERGLAQTAALWRSEDGDLEAFARRHFLPDETQRRSTFERFEHTFEQLDGHLYEITRTLRWPTDIDVGPLLKVDPLLGAFDPSAHLLEDLFASKLAFVVLLNFELTTLEQMTEQGNDWSRDRWARARLAQRFSRRVPAEVLKEIVKTSAEADLYIAQYNIWMHHLLNENGERLFDKGLSLISHWNLRDQLKADYASKNGLEKQRMIIKVMERIVTQTIPASVINNPKVDWNPYTNEVQAAPKDTIEKDAPTSESAKTGPEPDTRYAKLLAQFHAARAADPYSPAAPTQLRRAFDVGRELSEARVEGLFKEVLSSKLVPKIAALIEARLGRKLEAQDLWYDGFKARSTLSEAKLDAMTRARYPSAAAFKKDLPQILEGLDFSKARASYLAERIAVDPSRGAGHAMPAYRRGDLPRLRTRIGKDGMNYKGYNIAIHELGHNVEQVFSLYNVDHTLLSGVPNNAFTEALAFVFQARDLQLLGLEKAKGDAKHLKTLSAFWSTWEIGGVALVDTAVWRWMYENPNATPAELKTATCDIAKRLWNTYYAPVLGAKDSVLLAVYSHMISYPLYLANYPLGHLIAFQIEEEIEGRLQAGSTLGAEFERMASYGSVIPDLWMTHATSKPVSAKSLLNATRQALAEVSK